jgi:ribose 5-phosphate isomerase B
MTPSPSESQVRSLVRRSLERLLSTAPAPPSAAGPGRRPVLDADTMNRTPVGSTLPVPAEALVTPLAREAALERKIRIEPAQPLPAPPASAENAVAIGADHGGFALKEQLGAYLDELGWTPVDCGTFGPDSVDYPDYAYAVARMVAEGHARWGIVVDGAGIGSCMVANKVPGVRAALCYDLSSARNSREHNHANVLTLGAGLIGTNLALQIVDEWLATDWAGGRHERRVGMIDEIDRRYRT